MDKHAVLEEGQFDDAPERVSDLSAGIETTQTVDPRAGRTFVDEDDLLEWSSSSSEEEQDEFDDEEDAIEAAAFEGLRAEDEDWEIAERGVPTPEPSG